MVYTSLVASVCTTSEVLQDRISYKYIDILAIDVEEPPRLDAYLGGVRRR